MPLMQHAQPPDDPQPATSLLGVQDLSHGTQNYKSCTKSHSVQWGQNITPSVTLPCTTSSYGKSYLTLIAPPTVLLPYMKIINQQSLSASIELDIKLQNTSLSKNMQSTNNSTSTRILLSNSYQDANNQRISSPNRYPE
jgi:hypothetical protein